MAKLNVAPTTVLDAFFQDVYADRTELAKMVRDEAPFYAWLPKDAGARERRLVVPVMVGDPQAFGPTRTHAQTVAALAGAGAGNTVGLDWIVPYGGYKASHYMQHNDIKLNAGSERWLDLQKEAVDGKFRMWGQIHEAYLCRAAGHALASGTDSSGVQTLTSADDTRNFFEGMVLEVSADDGSSATHGLIASAGLGYVIAVDHDAGTVTVSATSGGAAGTPANWTGTMYYFRYGDFQGESAYIAYNIIDSIQEWVPIATPSATAFRNINRTTNVAALSGVRLATAEQTGSNVNRMRRLATKVNRVGYRVGGEMAFWCSPTQWENTAVELESKGIRDLTMKEAITGLEAIKIRTPMGTVPLLPGPCFPNTGCWLLSRNSMKLYTCGSHPEIMTEDGQRILRTASEDKYEIRLNGIAALCVRAPGANGYVPLAA